MSIAVCPGSFDPITLGHLDIARRARSMFDEVIFAVATNSAKTPLFDAERRLEFVAAATREMDGVRACLVPGLLADFCREVGAGAVVKGLRGGADVDHEVPMALMNRHLAGVETVFILGDQALAHVASSLVKDVARFGGAVDDLVPEPVAAALYAAVGRKPTTREKGARA